MKNDIFKFSIDRSPSPETRENWINVSAVGHYSHEVDNPPFYRDFYPGFQLFYTISGKGWLDYNGCYQIIEPGTITCINLEKRHGIGALEGNLWSHYWIICGGKIFEHMYKLIFEKSNVIYANNDSLFKTSFEKILNLMKEDYIYFDIKATTIILEILTYLLESSKLGKSDNINSLRFIEQVVNFIKNNYHREIKIEELSRISGYSLYHFSRIFKEYTSFSPNEYITKVRINNAKHLLKNSELPIDVIAGKCGFNTQNYFIKVFKAWESVTPGYYRRMTLF